MCRIGKCTDRIIADTDVPLILSDFCNVQRLDIGKNNEHLMLIGSLGHQVSRSPDRKPVSVASFGIIIKNAAVVPDRGIVIEQPQDRKAAHRAETHNSARDAASCKRFGNNICLGGDLCRPGNLGMGGIQQDIHAHIACIFIQDSCEDLFVVQFGSSPGKHRVERTGISFDRRRLHMQKNRVHDSGAEF